MVPLQAFSSNAFIILRKASGGQFFTIHSQLFLNFAIIFDLFIVIHRSVKRDDFTRPGNRNLGLIMDFLDDFLLLAGR
jgi:hypothetical protein